MSATNQPKHHEDAVTMDEAETFMGWASEQLGVDVNRLSADLAVAVEFARLKRGEPGQLGYLHLTRTCEHPDALLIYPSPELAEQRAQEPDADLQQEIAAHTGSVLAVPTTPITHDDLRGKEIVVM